MSLQPAFNYPQLFYFAIYTAKNGGYIIKQSRPDYKFMYMINIYQPVRSIISLFLFVAILIMFSGGAFVNTAYAAALLNKSDTMSSLKASTASNHTIVFRTPTGVDAVGETITITFPAGFTMNGLDFNDIDLAHSAGAQANCTNPTYSNEETLAASAAASAWGATLSGQVITLTPETSSPLIAANACVQIQIGTHATTGVTGDTQITNHATPAGYTIAIGGAFGDSGDILVNILGDDQVSVSATVDETLTFTISDNSIGFGALATNAARYATGDTNGSGSEAGAHDIIVATNAANGYTMTVNGTTLTYGAHSIDAIGAANTASSVGSEQFGIRIDESGGSGVVSAPYAAAGFAFDTAAFPDEIASAPGSTSSTTYSVRYLANIDSSTPAGAYTATLTYLATANF